MVESGRLDTETLREALARQKMVSGRLGTNLLEMGALDEEALLEGLGKQRATRTAGRAELRRIDRDILSLVPAKLAKRYRVIPYHVRGRTLFVASADPGDALQEDEIAFLTSHMVRTCVGLEVRIEEALQRSYGLSSSDRLATLARALDAGSIRRRPAPASKPRPTNAETPATEVPQRSAPAEVDTDATAAAPAAPASPAPFVPTTSVASPNEAPTDSLFAASAWSTVDAAALDQEPGEEGATERLPIEGPSSEAESIQAESIQAQPRAAEVSRIPPAPAAPSIAESAVAELTMPPAIEFIEIDSSEAERLRGKRVPEERGADLALVDGPARPVPEATQAAAPVQEVAPAQEVGSQSAAPVEGPMEPETRLARCARHLQQADFRDEIGDALLDLAAPWLPRRLLVIERKGRLVGWMGEGLEYPARDLEIEASEPSVFLGLRAAGALWRGRLPELAGNQALAEVLGGPSAGEGIALPLMVRSRVVAHLWGDRGDGGELGDVPVEVLQRAVGKAGLAFEVYLLKQKIRTL